jgi:hypothetical protein
LKLGPYRIIEEKRKLNLARQRFGHASMFGSRQ